MSVVCKIDRPALLLKILPHILVVQEKYSGMAMFMGHPSVQ
jgi:hypothetical protein